MYALNGRGEFSSGVQDEEWTAEEVRSSASLIPSGAVIASA